jgi:AcrR family transcriptional regulator
MTAVRGAPAGGTVPGQAGCPEACAAPRGRPRDAAVGRKVIDTVLRLIAEGRTFADLTMEGVAREAGVGKATVYRRWPGKDALFLDVLAAIDVHGELPDLRGDFRTELLTALESIRRRGLAKRDSAMLRNMLAQMQNSPQLWQAYHDTVIATRRTALTRLLEHGIATGAVRPELGRDLDLLVDFVVGPLLSRTAFRDTAPLDDGICERLADLLMYGLAP